MDYLSLGHKIIATLICADFFLKKIISKWVCFNEGHLNYKYFSVYQIVFYCIRSQDFLACAWRSSKGAVVKLRFAFLVSFLFCFLLKFFIESALIPHA